MGAGNVKAAFVRWSALPAVPMRALLYMAVVATDGTDHPHFWGGRESLALAIGRSKCDRAAIAAVDRALAVLVRAGAITLVGLPAPGKNAEYRLSLSMERTTLSVVGTDHGERGVNSPVHTTVSGTNGPRSAGQRTTVSVTTDHGERGPEEEQDLTGLKTGLTGPSRRARTSRAGTRTRASKPPPHQSMKGNDDTMTGQQRGLWPRVVGDE